MNLYRVTATVIVRHSEWSRPCHLPTFYIHGSSLEGAKALAVLTVSSGVAAPHTYRTSGSVVQVDSDLNPVDIDNTYPCLSWCDPFEMEAD